tara:strand:- start:6502 stop:6912 length:411 start_codon:yes stop_codon:yes gene_type:complete
MELFIFMIELVLQVFDKKVLMGIILASIPSFLWIFFNKTFARKKGLEDLKKDGELRIAKLNRRFYELEDFVKSNLTGLENSDKFKVSKEEMHEYLDEFKEEIKDVEKKMQTVVSSVGYLVQKSGGSIEDVLKIGKL